MKILFNLMTVLIGGEIAPIGYVIGIFFSVIGSILLYTSTAPKFIILGVILFLLGATILFFRIRKDVLEIRDNS
ncbi:MAG: hypothetical protein PHQ74_06015 [Crocinitomicaceae bacterium]|nr:hypothetical protein [Crocinitomicaceae bacterium]